MPHDGRLRLATLRAQDGRAIEQEALADERRLTTITDKAVAVPVAILKRHKLGTAKTSNCFQASITLLGKQVSIAVGAVRLVILRSELLPSQWLRAVRACEAVTMPRRVLKCDSTFTDHSFALGAALSILLFIAGNTDDVLVTWYKALVADWLTTFLAAEAMLMPLLAHVLVLLHTGTKYLSTLVAARCEVVIMAVGAVQLIVLRCKRSIHE